MYRMTRFRTLTFAVLAWVAWACASPRELQAPAKPERTNEVRHSDAKAVVDARGEVDEMKKDLSAATFQPIARERAAGAGYTAPATDPAPANTEEYAHFTDNGYRSAEREPLSTFAIDVDR